MLTEQWPSGGDLQEESSDELRNLSAPGKVRWEDGDDAGFCVGPAFIWAGVAPQWELSVTGQGRKHSRAQSCPFLQGSCSPPASLGTFLQPSLVQVIYIYGIETLLSGWC